MREEYGKFETGTRKSRDEEGGGEGGGQGGGGGEDEGRTATWVRKD